MNPTLEIPRDGVATRVPATQWRSLYEQWGLKGGRSENWEWGFRTGNGAMGALMLGDVKQDAIYLAHERVYVPINPHEVLPDMGKHMGEYRRLIREEGYKVANAFYLAKAKEAGFAGLVQSDPIQPALALRLTAPEGETSDYLMTEDFASGEVAAGWRRAGGGRVWRRMFVSRCDEVLAVEWAGEEGDPAGVSGTIELEAPPAFGGNGEQICGRYTADERFLVQSVGYRLGPEGYDAVVAVQCRGGEVRCDGRKVVIRQARSIHLTAAIALVKDRAESGVDQLKHKLEGLPGFEELRQRHVAVHRPLYERMRIGLGEPAPEAALIEDLFREALKSGELSTALLEKVYNGSRYLFLCSSGDVPPWLLGRWVGTFQPAWSGDLTLDTNVQLAISSALSCGQSEVLARALGYFESLLPHWRENARKLLGCGGILASIRAGRNGLHHHWNDHWSLFAWTAGAGWLGNWFYDYYRFTGDRDFLRSRCLPYLREVARFYEDFLTQDADGTCRFSPSYSPETAALDNATLDVAVARQVFTNLLATCAELDVHADECIRWRKLRALLPEYQVHQPGDPTPPLPDAQLNMQDQRSPAAVAGTVKEFLVDGAPEFYGHRHFSHMYPVMYSHELTEMSDPRLWAAMHCTLTEKLKAIKDSDAHGRMHAAMIAAYLGRGEDVWSLLRKLILGSSIYTSMHASHYDGHFISCFDANGALPGIVNNCIIFRRGMAEENPIELLPALPAALVKGWTQGACLRGQITVEHMAWDVKQGNITLRLRSGKAQRVTLQAPRGARMLKVTITPGDARVATDNQEQLIPLRLPAGVTTLEIEFQSRDSA